MSVDSSLVLLVRRLVYYYALGGQTVAVTWCNSIGPFDAICELGKDHDGRHEGHDVHGYMFYWLEEDYPMTKFDKEK